MDATLAAIFVSLFAAHQVADHWVQTSHQADTKGLPGWRGRIACATHVAVHTAISGLFLTAAMIRADLQLDTGPTLTGLVVSAVSHYYADRRSPLRWLANTAGKDPEWLDQSWRIGWMFIAALVMA